VNSENSDGRSVSSNAGSGLLKVEILRSSITRQHGETQNQQQGHFVPLFSPKRTFLDKTTKTSTEMI